MTKFLLHATSFVMRCMRTGHAGLKVLRHHYNLQAFLTPGLSEIDAANPARFKGCERDRTLTARKSWVHHNCQRDLETPETRTKAQFMSSSYSYVS